MTQAIGQTLPYAVAVSLSPIPIIAVVLMLSTPRGGTNGPAFILGWIAGLAIAGALVLVVSGGANASESGQPADWVNILMLLLGAGLLVVAAKQWRGRPRGDEEAELPKWMKSVDHFTFGRAAALGVGLSALNPKNLILILGAATAIAQTGISGGEQAEALAVFVVIATLGPCVPVAIFVTMGDRSHQILDDLKGWMAHNNGAIMAVLCLIIGAKLIGDGIAGF